jgi:hypothetical protein
LAKCARGNLLTHARLNAAPPQQLRRRVGHRPKLLGPQQSYPSCHTWKLEPYHGIVSVPIFYYSELQNQQEFRCKNSRNIPLSSVAIRAGMPIPFPPAFSLAPWHHAESARIDQHLF